MSAHVQTSKAARVSPKTVEIHIRRRANPDSPPYWERFELSIPCESHIISCLMEIQKNPITMEGNSDNPTCVADELSRTGVWHLHDGYQWTSATVVLSAH